jgi:hypothetical protein
LLRGQGVAIAQPRRAGAPWVAAGGAAVVRLALTPRWALVGAAQLARPLRQTRFAFAEPHTVVAHTPPRASAGSLGVAVRFP